MKIGIFILMLFCSNILFGQQELPEDLKNICHTWEISFPEHQDKGTKISIGPKRFDQQFDVLIEDKKEDYSVLTFFNPHSRYNGIENAAVRSMIKATHFASNVTDGHIAMHSLDSDYVRDEFGADWGAIYYFKPKIYLSDQQECQMVVLESAGRGIFYTLYFFEQLSNDVEDLKWCPQFHSKEQ